MIHHKIRIPIFYYPLVMSVIWIVGSLIFYWRRERSSSLPSIAHTPRVSLLIPTFNEQDTIVETVEKMQNLHYPNYEIVVIDDGSQDNTPQLLRRLIDHVSNLRVIRTPANRGKAHALTVGLLAAQGEILVTVDSDAILDPDALTFLVAHFDPSQSGERVGAVTGNPRVRNRNSLLSKIQLVEYASIIGLIKRSQRILGKVMTVSGVIVAFRKRALLDCGLWDSDIITEDIAVTWKLEQRFWDIRYEPRAICWMLVPETLRGLWKQRVRWAQGGLEVLSRHWHALFIWKQRRLWPVIIEQYTSIVWAVVWVVFTLILMGRMIVTHGFYVPIFWMGTYLAVLSLIQAAVALTIDHHYEHGVIKYYWWSVWYPSLYWFINAVVIVFALLRSLVHH
ncbi:poly-beta-1,6-N-acetyl-D-glucosamine synthase [Sulfobacillus sp. hq2]|uniref:poly-beta-1,6-N-acetyl-D-glucosamine synthase n=1 Tax=Sulfobacillus TaxID=28033 RepID=UPI002101D35E|nr:poly-beta-1,6-N-acetyl-D-glucosamine synthase [Sulfobacillus sp. hq2]